PLWVLWTAPFVAIAVWFTIRRAIDAGRSPWWGLAILVPFVNFAVMIAFALAPSRPAPAPAAEPPLFAAPPSSLASPGGAMLLGIAGGALYAIGLTVLSIYALGSYGAALFFGTPLLSGAIASFTYNFERRRGWAGSLLISLLPVIAVGAALIVLALEGAICLVMAAPIMLPLALVGGAFGKTIASLSRADVQRSRELAGCLVVLPLLALGETRLPHNYEFCATSSVEVDAPPEVVWRNVVDFPPIESPEPWLFRLGIAGPQGARIEGQGVGAVRHCDFSTGSFVEPITAWDEPRRLAFDVTDQPDPMFELSPYREVRPPHLAGSFRSTRGQFVLEPLPGDRTRLSGSTWYRLDLAPQAYWTMWTDWIVHRIHGRVLQHIKTLAEAAAP
ncbi:MAG TPA: SRPBCC family protein, partial [Lacipirellulaceae bacterium]|nr:SRPBCC family protein [Lacipirellulaceae bacterium]